MVQNNLEALQHTDLKKLSSVELLTGILVYARDLKFPEQALYELFREIGKDDRDLARRFRVFGNGIGELRSEPLRRILDHLEMGKVLELPQPNPVDQFYTLRSSQRKTVEQDLQDRGVLPTYEKQLQELSDRLSTIAHEASHAERSAKPSAE